MATTKNGGWYKNITSQKQRKWTGKPKPSGHWTSCSCGHPKAWLFDSQIRANTHCRFCGSQYVLPSCAVGPVADDVWTHSPQTYLQAAQLGLARTKLDVAKKENKLEVVQILEDLYPEFKEPEINTPSPYQALQSSTAKHMSAVKQVEYRIKRTVDLSKQLEAARIAAAEAVATQAVAEKELLEARKAHNAHRGIGTDDLGTTPTVPEGDGDLVMGLDKFWATVECKDNNELSAMFATLKANLSTFKETSDRIRKEQKTRKDDEAAAAAQERAKKAKVDKESGKDAKGTGDKDDAMGGANGGDGTGGGSSGSQAEATGTLPVGGASQPAPTAPEAEDSEAFKRELAKARAAAEQAPTPGPASS